MLLHLHSEALCSFSCCFLLILIVYLKATLRCYSTERYIYGISHIEYVQLDGASYIYYIYNRFLYIYWLMWRRIYVNRNTIFEANYLMRERKLARDWERLSYGQGFQGIEYALSTVTIYIYSSYIMGRYISYLDLILANVYNLEFLDVTVIYMSYMNVYIYICYTIYIYTLIIRLQIRSTRYWLWDC